MKKPYEQDINDLVSEDMDPDTFYKGGPGSGIKGHLSYHPESFEHHRLMAGHHEIKEKRHAQTASDFKSSSDGHLQNSAKAHQKKADEHGKKAEEHMKQAKEKHNPKVHGPWNHTIPSEVDSTMYGNQQEIDAHPVKTSKNSPTGG